VRVAQVRERARATAIGVAQVVVFRTEIVLEQPEQRAQAAQCAPPLVHRFMRVGCRFEQVLAQELELLVRDAPHVAAELEAGLDPVVHRACPGDRRL
jgi:hypothetical protein